MLSNLFRNLPPVTLNLLIINVLVYLGVMLFPQFYEMLSLHYVESTLFQPHQIVTHMFMHSKYGITHIFFNMFALVMFGSAVEKQIGAKKFLILYFLSGLGAMSLQLLSYWYQLSDIPPEVLEFINTKGVETVLEGKNYSDPILGGYNAAMNGGMVGASGAIMGVLVAFGYYNPNTELMLIFLPIPIKAKFFIPILIVLEMTLGVANFQWDNFAHWAHIGGAIAGFIIVSIWKKDRNNFY
ncbi:MAG: membrane associated rhomboid family serine protease [Urechidicola sp.]|jgi:membrane associated rhomboid family serine protease|tara:strand:- start:2232 stop:2951 length:720 start_codon:yes stop_codon:yes gene_type:complete